MDADANPTTDIELENVSLAPNSSSVDVAVAATSTQNLLPLANAEAPSSSNASSIQTSTPAPAPTSPPTTSTAPTPPAPTHPSTPQASRRQKVASILKYALKPTLVLITYALTLSTALTARSASSPLGRVPPEWGIWILAILGKAGDISFAFAVEDAFDTLAWRKLRRRRRIVGSLGLLWWLSMLSSTGFETLVQIVWKGVRGVAGKWWRSRERIPRRERWKDWKEVRWSVVRLVFLGVLIPGPGIILLANITPTTVIHPTHSMSVTGGLATYDPRIAEVYHTKWAPEIAKLVQSTLRDPSIAWRVDAVGAACTASISCEAYLLAGPYATVSPWPFTNETAEGDEEGFLLEKAPVYMVELWDLEPGDEEGVFDMQDECVLYGGLDAEDEFSTLVCIADRGVDHQLAAAWSACQLGYAPNGTCLSPATLPGRYGWKTHLKFYRRTANIVFSRALFTILSVTNPSTPTPTSVPATQLFRALNTIFYRPNASTNDARYDRKAHQYILTQSVGIQLWTALRERARGASFGRDWLRNALVLPVYLFQPTVLAIDDTLPTTPDGTLPQPYLPAENQLRGSYCRVSSRAVPGRGTVIAYACVAGLVVVVVVAVKGVAWRWGEVETSGFVMADLDVLASVVTEGARPEEVRLRSRIGVGRGGRGISGKEVLQEIEDLRVVLR